METHYVLFCIIFYSILTFIVVPKVYTFYSMTIETDRKEIGPWKPFRTP